MLTEIKLKNFKCFKDEVTIPADCINLFTGLNGRGKSTALQPMLCLRQSLENVKAADTLFLNGSCVSLGNYSDIKNVSTPRSEDIEFVFEFESETKYFSIVFHFEEYEDDDLVLRILINLKMEGALLNFTGSSLPDGESVTIQKGESRSETAILDSFEERETLNQWLKDFQPLETIYSFDSSEPPVDEQTVLRDSLRFRSTNRLYQGRRIYEELTTGNFWYVDNLHYGNDSHLEVFDKRGSHLGEANLEGKLIPGTKKKERNIKDLI